jgi:hypothetical protein
MSRVSEEAKKSRSEAIDPRLSLSSGAEHDATEAAVRGEEAAERVREWEREVDEVEATDTEEAPSSQASAISVSWVFFASTAGHLAVTFRSRNGHFRIPSFLREYNQLMYVL